MGGAAPDRGVARNGRGRPRATACLTNRKRCAGKANDGSWRTISHGDGQMRPVDMVYSEGAIPPVFFSEPGASATGPTNPSLTLRALKKPSRYIRGYTSIPTERISAKPLPLGTTPGRMR